MLVLFQSLGSEESLPTAAATTELPLSTFEEEEAGWVPTVGLVPLMPTALPEAAVTPVSVS